MMMDCKAKPATTSHKLTETGYITPTTPPNAAPKGRAPVLTTMLMDVTRPIMARGVTVWRKVVEVMVQMMGPTPKKKYDNAATQACGQYKDAAMVAAANTEK